jgi:hypothetical protein
MRIERKEKKRKRANKKRGIERKEKHDNPPSQQSSIFPNQH